MKLLLVSLLPLAVIACPSGYDIVYDGFCSKDLGNGSIDSARLTCNSVDGYLPIIHSLEEQNNLFQFFGQRTYWLDLSCNGTKFKWADGSEVTYTGGLVCDISQKGYNYVLNSNGIWDSTSLGEFSNTYSICQLSYRNYACDSKDYMPVQVESGKADAFCFMVETAPVKWSDAEATCITQQAHVAAVHDQATNNALRRTAVAYGMTDGIHLGLKVDDRGNYKWSDGSAEDYTNFGAGFPDPFYGDCISMLSGQQKGQWMNMQCDVTLPYICTKPAVVFNASAVPAGCPDQDEYYPGDEIFSPSWPEATGPAYCEYAFMVHDTEKRIQIEIQFLESNSCCDTLTFYQGMFGSSVIKSFKGYLGYTSTLVTSSSNTMRMQWDAKSGANVRGWHVKANAV